MSVSGTKLDTDTVQPDIPASPGPQAPSSTPGPAPCHLTQNARQTRAMADSIASEQAIEEACKVGKDWATDSSELTTRVVSYVSVGLDTLPELDEDGNDDWDNIPTLHSTTVNHTPLLEPDNHWLPDSYAEAMTWPDLWQGPIEKELEVMHEQEV